MTEKEMQLAAKDEERRQKEIKIYESYGISQDKLEGSRQFANALFKGAAMVVSAVSLLLVAACGILAGVTSALFVFSICSMAVEGTLLAQEERPNKPMLILSRVFFFFPMMMTATLLILYLINRTVLDIHPAYEIVLIVFVGMELAMTGFGSISYYIYEPYRAAHKQIRAARREIKDEGRKQKQQEKRQRKMSLAAIRREEKARKKEQKRLRRMDRKERLRREREQLKAFAVRQQMRAANLTHKKAQPTITDASAKKNEISDSRKNPKRPA